MEEFSLVSSGKKFSAFEAPKNHYVNLNELLKYPERYKDKVKKDGFVVIKNVISEREVSKLRNNYYSLFINEYRFEDNSRNQLSNPIDSHGYGNHPVKNFLKSENFLNFVNDKQLKRIASILLGSKETVLSKRILLRSFQSAVLLPQKRIEIKNIMFVLTQPKLLLHGYQLVLQI